VIDSTRRQKQKLRHLGEKLGPLKMFSWMPRDPLPIGTKAPNFTLSTEAGKKVRLSALRGKNVVLVFYPGDDTLICRRQLCEFRDAWSELRGQNILVFGINPQSPESHREFSARNKFPFPLLVDEGQKVAALYNSDGGMVNRTVYLVGPDGLIRYARRGMPRPEEVLAAAVKKRRVSARKPARTRTSTA
jgi:peroxiredoxin Q/BCP